MRELPKLAVFPTPKPLSPEEAALVKFSARSSPEVKAAVVQAAKQPEDLTTVAALKMRPFNPGEDQESANDKEELP